MSTAKMLKELILEQGSSAAEDYLFSEEFRSQAVDRLKQGHFPNRKDEEWRYTPVKRLLDTPFDGIDSKRHVEEEVQQAKSAIPEARHLVFLDGKFSEAHSDSVDDVRGLNLVMLSRDDRPAVQDAAEMIMSAKWSDENIFKDLSIGLGNHGVFISVDENTEVKTPLHFIYLNSGGQQITHPLSFVKIGTQSALSVVEQFVSDSASAQAVIPASFMEVGVGARLNHYKIGLESGKTEHISNTHVDVADSASANLQQYLLGSNMTRSNTEVTFSGSGADLTLRGIYLGERKQHLDIRTYVDHALPHCKSDQHFRGILNDSARGVFNGLVLVQPDAQHTDAVQSNKNLLLSDEARVDTKPQLEIFADDVKCAHGATVGQLDQDALFYLQSRAISKNDARLLLTRAFTFEVTQDIHIDSLRSYVEENVSNRLNKLHHD